MTAFGTVSTAIATYYLVTVQDQKNPRGTLPPIKDCPERKDKVQECRYFAFDPSTGWSPVCWDAMAAQPGGDYVRLVQLTNLKGKGEVVEILEHECKVFEADVTLLAAVAKTLDQPNPAGPLPNMFMACTTEKDWGPAVIIPVSPGAKRGVILIFTTQSNGQIDHVRATLDPEIKGSTN